MYSHILEFIHGHNLIFVKKTSMKQNNTDSTLFVWEQKISWISEACFITGKRQMYIWVSSLASTRRMYYHWSLPHPGLTLTNIFTWMFFFFPVILRLATILPFCLSTPFWSCEINKNTFLNGRHITVWLGNISLIIWQRKKSMVI